MSELPPLPEPGEVFPLWGDYTGNAYTADQMRAYALAAVEADRAARTEPGWVLVPVEPTDAMRAAGMVANHEHDERYSKDCIYRTVRIYRAMLAAAPKEGAR